MDVVNTILLWLHFLGLAIGGAAAFGIPVIGRQMAGAVPESRPQLMGLMHALSKVGRAGLGLLIVTGPLLVWLKYNGVGELSHWFWLKMVLVVLLIIGVIVSSRLAARLEAGDLSAASMAPRIGIANTAVLVLIVLSAVLAFG